MELKPVATYTKCICAIFALLQLHDLGPTQISQNSNNTAIMCPTVLDEKFSAAGKSGPMSIHSVREVRGRSPHLLLATLD